MVNAKKLGCFMLSAMLAGTIYMMKLLVHPM